MVRSVTPFLGDIRSEISTKMTRSSQIPGQCVAGSHHAAGPKVADWKIEKQVWKRSSTKSLTIFRKEFVELNNTCPVFRKEKEIHEQMAARRTAGVRLDQSMAVRKPQFRFRAEAIPLA